MPDARVGCEVRSLQASGHLGGLRHAHIVTFSRRIGAGVLVLLALITLRGNAGPTSAFVVLGLLYFPRQTHFRLHGPKCEQLLPTVQVLVVSCTTTRTSRCSPLLLDVVGTCSGGLTARVRLGASSGRSVGVLVDREA